MAGLNLGVQLKRKVLHLFDKLLVIVFARNYVAVPRVVHSLVQDQLLLLQLLQDFLIETVLQSVDGCC